MQATGETLVTPLTFPVLDVFLFTAFSIPDQCVDAMIGDAKVDALGIGAGVAFGGNVLLTATCAFALGVGDDIRVRF